MQNTFQIRVATVDDAKGILDIYKGYVEETAVTFEHTTPTVEGIASTIVSTLKSYPFLVALHDDVIVGYSYANSFRKREGYAWSVECSIYVSPTERKTGVGRALYVALENALREMGVLNLYACIAFSEEPDEHLTDASIRFHERMGFSEVGRFSRCGCKFGKWYGIVWMGKSIGEHVDNQPAPSLFCGRI